jgi:hypothetical protein
MQSTIQIVCVLALTASFVSTGARAEIRAEVRASEHKISFFDGELLLKSYRVSLGSRGIGKCKAGDKHTPLGTYTLCKRVLWAALFLK